MMASHAERRLSTGKRNPIRSTAESLPTPLPPPPHRTRATPGPGIAIQVRTGNLVPPPPHFETRFSEIDPAKLDASASDEPVPERSLMSPGVMFAIAASIVLMCGIGWYEMSGSPEIQWDTIKSMVQQFTAEPSAPEEALPYITAVPIVPSGAGAQSVAKSEASPAKKTGKVMLSDHLKDEPHSPDSERGQLR